MTVETATYISDLDASKPGPTDLKSEGDDHLRLVKSSLKATFPNIAGAVTPSHVELGYVAGVTSAIQNQLNAKGNTAGQAWTGTHDFSGASAVVVPTALAGDNSTKAASTAFVLNQAFSTVLPSQNGNAGKVVTTDGSAASWTNSLSGLSLQSPVVDSLNGGALAGFRNRVSNGSFAVAQRGSSFPLTTSAQYTADRWAAYVSAGTAAATVSQVAVGASGFQYGLKVQRTSGSTNTSAVIVAQALESINSIPLAGKTVTVSFYAVAGANFSGSTSKINLAIATGTGTDQAVQGIYGGSWTGWTAPLNTVQVISASLQRYSFSVTIPANATQIGFAVWFVPTGTAGSDDSFTITGVQIEPGSVATPFESRPYGLELQLCQRYYQTLGPGLFLYTANYTNAVWAYTPLPVPMRAAPTVSQTAAIQITDPGTGGFTQSAPSVSVGTSSATGFYVRLDNFTGLTAYRAYTYNSLGLITLSAEL